MAKIILIIEEVNTGVKLETAFIGRVSADVAEAAAEATKAIEAVNDAIKRRAEVSG